MDPTTRTFTYRNGWDRAGISTSFLCVMHCLLTPVFITALPALAATEHQAHSLFAIAILLLGMLAFVPGYRTHRRKWIPAAGFAGVSMIIIAALLPGLAYAELLETGLVLAGGVTLISAHVRNAFWCRFCARCKPAHRSTTKGQGHASACS